MKRTSLYSKEHRVLARLLRKLRLKKGLSQAAVGKALGRPQAYVSAVETFIRGVDLLQLRELVQLYDVRLRDFIDLYEADLASSGDVPDRELRAGAKPRPKRPAATRYPLKKASKKTPTPVKKAANKRAR